MTEIETTTTIQIRLFAGLDKYAPALPDPYPIKPGTSFARLLKILAIPEDKARLLFINGKKAGLQSILNGNERIGIFPPVGGG